MKKTILLILAFFFAGIIMSCEDGADGIDGEDGSAFIRFSWDWYVDTYDDNNPDLPSTISENYNYETLPGTYSFLYTCSDGMGNSWYWEGYYTIQINYGEPGEPGEPAGLFSDGADGADGADGEDNYYRMFLDGLVGASLTLTKAIIGNKEIKTELSTPAKDFNKSDYIAEGDIVISRFNQSGREIYVEKQLYIAKDLIQE